MKKKKENLSKQKSNGIKRCVMLPCVAFVFVLIGGLFGCTRDTSNAKYKVGDIVYLKPDSTKAVIEELNWRDWMYLYDVKISRNNNTWYSKSEENVSEEMIY